MPVPRLNYLLGIPQESSWEELPKKRYLIYGGGVLKKPQQEAD